jgi:hypothetical protein
MNLAFPLAVPADRPADAMALTDFFLAGGSPGSVIQGRLVSGIFFPDGVEHDLLQLLGPVAVVFPRHFVEFRDEFFLGPNVNHHFHTPHYKRKAYV